MAARPAPSAPSISAVMRSTSCAELVVERLDLARPHAQHGIRVLADLGERDEPSRLALGVRLPLLGLLSLVGSAVSGSSPRRQCTQRALGATPCLLPVSAY